MVLDTGAEVTIVSTKFIKALFPNRDLRVRSRRVRSLSKHLVTIQGPITLTIDVCCFSLQQPVYFCEDTPCFILKYDLIQAAAVIIDPVEKCVWSKHTLRYGDFFDVTCEYRPVPTESSDAQQPQGHSSTFTSTVGVDAKCNPRANYAISISGPEGCASSLAPASLQPSQYRVTRSPFNVNAPEFCPDTPTSTVGVDAKCGPRANYATYISGPEGCASSLAPASLQPSQYGVTRSPFNVNAPEFCPDTPYFTSDTDRALLPDDDSEQTYLKQQQYYCKCRPSDHTRHEPVQSTQSADSDLVPPQDRPPDVLVCPQDRPPDNLVRPQDRPPDRSMNSDKPTDSDETHLKFVDDDILMLRTKPNNKLPKHVNVSFLKTLENVDLNPETQEVLKQLLSDHRDTFATSSLDLGFFPLVQHDIDTGDARPIRQSPRIPPMSAREAEDEILDEMLFSGVIQPSTSSWASPVCLVKALHAKFGTLLTIIVVDFGTYSQMSRIPPIADLISACIHVR